MELCLRPGLDWQKTWSALHGAWSIHLARPDLRKACEITAELVARAEEHRSSEHIAIATHLLAISRMDSGDFELAAESFDRETVLWESIPKPEIALREQRAGLMPQARRLAGRANNRVQSAWNLWFLGFPDQARHRVSIAIAIAGDSRRKNTLATVHNIAMRVYELRR